MALTSPATMLTWSVLCVGLGSFLIYHLWCFDRFKCLKWHTGPYSGTFKRAMTYTYVIGIPLIITYSIGMTIIKYEEGFVLTEGASGVPKPVTMFSEHYQNAVLPLMICFSVGWSIELVTHLQELCFWLFLVNSRSAQQDWFRSLYFRIWVIGSAISVLYMPLVTGFTHKDPIKSEAWTFLAGSIGSTIITLWFLPILYTFPSFLDSLKAEDVDRATIVRLTKFHELNVIRVLFRILFCIPLLIIGIDGVKAPHTINSTLVAIDLLAIVSGFGFVVSSGITLIIFFPRSIEAEIATADAAKGIASNIPNQTLLQNTSLLSRSDIESIADGFTSPQPAKEGFSTYSGDFDAVPETPNSAFREKSASPRGMRPNRRVGSNVELGGIDPDKDDPLTEQNLAMHTVTNANGETRQSRYHPAAHNFTSPLDIGKNTQGTRLVGHQMSTNNSSRLTFNRRIT